MSDNSRPKPVIENHLPVYEMILEVNVGGVSAQVVHYICQGKVMRSHNADCPSLDKFAEDGAGADPPIVRIRSA